MLKSCGECDHPDEMNVPVDIWLDKINEDENPELIEEGFIYYLRASNYIPRKNMISGNNSYVYYSDNKEELQEIIKNNFLPLYKIATARLEKMAEGTKNYLYYWEEVGASDEVSE